MGQWWSQRHHRQIRCWRRSTWWCFADHPTDAISNRPVAVTANCETIAAATMLDVKKYLQLTFLQTKLYCIQKPQSNPTFDCLKKPQTQLNLNAISIHSNAGDGRIGHYYLVTTANKYHTKSNQEVKCGASINTGTEPPILLNSTRP